MLLDTDFYKPRCHIFHIVQTRELPPILSKYSSANFMSQEFCSQYGNRIYSGLYLCQFHEKSFVTQSQCLKIMETKKNSKNKKLITPIIVSLQKTGSQHFFFIYIPIKVFPPSSPSFSSPVLPPLCPPPPIHSSVSVWKGVGLPQVSAKHDVSSYTN